MGRYTVSGSGADCKSVVFDSGSSTLSLPTKVKFETVYSYVQTFINGKHAGRRLSTPRRES